MAKIKACSACGAPMPAARPLQRACSVVCAQAIVSAKQAARRAKADRADIAQRKLKMRTKRDWVKLAQIEFNRYIRARDADLPCISCDTISPDWRPGGLWDCGHYLTVGAHPELRFNEQNAHKQCKKCNGGSKYTHKEHSVHRHYRDNLVKKIGLNAVLTLERTHRAKHYAIDDLIAIRDKYRKLTREITREITQ